MRTCNVGKIALRAFRDIPPTKDQLRFSARIAPRPPNLS